MTTNSSLGSKIVATELIIQRLLKDAALVGGIYTMGYDQCLVLTNDLWKRNAGGIPQHCFLLASAMDAGTAPDPEDEEVVLLRVVGPAPLPAEADLVQVREQAMREMVVTQGREGAATSPAILDVLTRNEIQFSGISAKILGTFYGSGVSEQPLLLFGSDVETFHSASRYKVYKPYGESLSIIASYPEMTEREAADPQSWELPPKRVRIGIVRYSSSNRRSCNSQASPQTIAVPVRVNVDDFVAMKTAVFGMTRQGKSNTMKTIATAVFEYAAETGQKIGQLLFDPAGEYANVNVQDETALSQVGSEFVTIFRYGADGSEPGVRPLSSNFFSDDTIQVTWAIVTAALAARSQGTDYLKSFLAADVSGPEDPKEDWSAYSRARRRRAAFYATLLKAGFTPPESLRTEVAANNSVLTAVNDILPDNAAKFESSGKGIVRLNAENLVQFWDCVLRAKAGGHIPEDWGDPQLDAILAVYGGTVGSGFRVLQPLRRYHSVAREDDYAQEVLDHLVDGKIVIVDLSLGSETVLKFCSERIINFILEDASRRFADGEDLRQIQIYIEEAHRLFNRDKMNAPQESDPYVRLAKEAAKYRIGLIYATQEVSSVDPFILSNTSNWIVTHLNNKAEVRELSKYYDFEDFAALTMKAENVGFARMKTRSGRYIIPVQIDVFEKDRVAAAREAGLAAKSQASGTAEEE